MKDGKNYILKGIAENYEKERFFGEGGKYADCVERLAIHDMIADRKGRILDLACGTGRMVKDIEMNGRDFVGVDLSLEMLLQAKGNIDAPLLQGDVFGLPFGNASFDIVVASRLLYFIDNPATFFDEVNRVLKEGGIFVFNTCNRYSTRGILNLLFRFISRDHGIRLTTYKELKNNLTSCGYEVLNARRAFSLPLNSYRLYPPGVLKIVQYFDRMVPAIWRVMIFVKCKKRSLHSMV
jgi:ubiquinone/menaquinone biosynthesis C-methylase UbiE